MRRNTLAQVNTQVRNTYLSLFRLVMVLVPVLVTTSLDRKCHHQTNNHFLALFGTSGTGNTNTQSACEWGTFLRCPWCFCTVVTDYIPIHIKSRIERCTRNYATVSTHTINDNKGMKIIPLEMQVQPLEMQVRPRHQISWSLLTPF